MRRFARRQLHRPEWDSSRPRAQGFQFLYLYYVHMWVWWAMHGVEPRPAEPWRRAGGRSKQLWASTRITIMMLVSIMYCTINSVLNAYRTPITGGGVLPQLVLRVKIPFKDTVKEHDSSCAMRHRMGLATCAKETPHLGCNNAAIRLYSWHKTKRIVH